MKDKVFDNIIKKINQIKQIVGLSKQEVDLLLTPKKVKKAKIKIRNHIFPAWRILFNDALGPGKGGIRFHIGASQDEVQSLAFWMVMKCSLLGLPYGGAKGGIKFDPKKFSNNDLEQISRKFIDKFYKVLGQDKDIPAPDVYTNSQVMAWMLDEYEKKVGHHEPGMITGKPLELQGCELRADATAKGAFIITNELINEFLPNKKNLSFAIQGFGNAGSNLARMLYDSGLKVVAVSDSKGGIYNKSGLNIIKVIDIKNKTGSLSEFKQASKITNSQLLELDVDVLLLAALENQITIENANKIKAKYIVELANGPITYDADNILFAKNIIVVPDILANAGGVVVSYFEWTQNRTGNILDKEYLEDLLKKKMVYAWQKVLKEQQNNKNKISLRTSAYLIAIKRVLSAERSRGRIK